MALRKEFLFSLVLVIVESFQPNCDKSNQFRFHCFPIEYCNNYDCFENNCGRYLVNSKIVRVKTTSIIPKCAFTNSEVLQHIYGVNSQIEVVASGAFVNLSNLSSINLSFNLIQQLHSKTFDNVSAVSLDLSWNKLVYIQEDAFLGLHNLQYLNLSKNELTTVPIQQIPLYLTELNLSYNLFQRILLNSKRTPSLTDIDLSYNLLDKIALSFDNHVRKIDLTHNKLSKFDFMDIPSCDELRISLNRFSFVPEPLTYLSVKKVSLYPNPWRCDELQNLWHQLQNNYVTILLEDKPNKTENTSPICVVSETSGILVSKTNEELVQGCEQDDHCDDNMLCRTKQCLDPCKENACDSTSICSTLNHRLVCFCPDAKKKDPKDPYSPCLDVECFSNKDCTGQGFCDSEQKCVFWGDFNQKPMNGFGSHGSGHGGYGGYGGHHGGHGGYGGGGGYSVSSMQDNDEPSENEEKWWTYEIPKTSPSYKGNVSQ